MNLAFQRRGGLHWQEAVINFEGRCRTYRAIPIGALAGLASRLSLADHAELVTKLRPSFGHMSTIIPARTKPEDEELAKKRLELTQLESELADRELHIATLRAEMSEFERQYLRIVGSRYAELDEINAQIAEQLARKRSDDAQLWDAAKQARSQADESRSAAEAHASDKHGRALPSQELKSLYREVAKRVHPDLSTDPDDRKTRERLMAEANRAYERGDAARLKQILEEYESSPDAVKGEAVGAELVRIIRKIAQVRRRLTEIEREIEQLLGSELAKLKLRAEEYEKQGRDLLKEMADQVDRQITAARQRIDVAG